MIADGCRLCKYVLADVHNNGPSPYRCTNQDSPRFGEETTEGCSEYEQFNSRPDISFKDALEKLVMMPRGAYTDYFFLFGKPNETSRPFYCITFTDNKQMFEYREAMLRCFDELMKLKEEAGDFEKVKEEEE